MEDRGRQQGTRRFPGQRGTQETVGRKTRGPQGCVILSPPWQRCCVLPRFTAVTQGAKT